MELLQLEYFAEVARVGNMTKAAENLHVSQSSISRNIAHLEEQLGVPLFERRGRGLILNDYGRILYQRAETVFRNIKDGTQEIIELRDQQLGRISISTSSTRQINHLMLNHFTENPNVLFRQQRITDIDLIREKLNSGEIDFALTYTPINNFEYEWTPLMQEESFILMSSKDELSQKSGLDYEDLTSRPLLINAANDPEFVESRCIQHGIHPVFSFITDEYEILGQMVERNLGIAFISSLELYDMRKFLPVNRFSKICIKSIGNRDFVRTTGIIRSKNHYLSASAKDFYKELISYFKRISEEMQEIATELLDMQYAL